MHLISGDFRPGMFTDASNQLRMIVVTSEIRRIEVCFAIHDPTGDYAKYMGIAIQSLLENTSSNVSVHILHDDTLSVINIGRLKKTVTNCGGEIQFHKIESSRFLQMSGRVKAFTVGSLFRLMIPLISTCEKIIYLDADIIVNMDIKEMWDIKLGDKSVAACLDLGVYTNQEMPLPCKNGLVDNCRYFNSGVLVMNLNKIRQDKNLFQDAIKYLEDNPESFFPDQDALNVIFKDKVLYLPNKYNMFTRFHRESEQIDGIVHFPGDHVRTVNRLWFDELFFDLWKRSEWGDAKEIFSFFFKREDMNKNRILTSRYFARALAYKRKICIWGAGSVLNEVFDREYSLCNIIEFYIDNNRNYIGKLKNNLKIYTPEYLWQQSECHPFVVVFSVRSYEEIKAELVFHGYNEDEDIIDGALLFSEDERGRYAGY